MRAAKSGTRVWGWTGRAGLGELREVLREGVFLLCEQELGVAGWQHLRGADRTGVLRVRATPPRVRRRPWVWVSTLRLKPQPLFELVWHGRFWIPGGYHTY